MKITKAKKLAEGLIGDFCPDYRLEFSNRYRTRFGCCNCRTQTITLSTKLVELNDESKVRDTILHEIAHALTKGHGHDEVWRMTAKKLGCNGERTYKTSDVRIPKRRSYVYECPNCGKRTTKYKRVSNLACGKCCREFNGGKYSDKYRIKLVKENQ